MPITCVVRSPSLRVSYTCALRCVTAFWDWILRNTIIEDYHAQGKLSDPEMKVFNQEVVNKIYTFLTFLLSKPEEERASFLLAMSQMYPSDWDKPRIDQDFAKAAKLFKGNNKPLGGSAP